MLSKVEEANKLGSIRLVPEQTADDPTHCWFVFGGRALKLATMSFKPDPYLVMYRQLPDGSMTPIYRTECFRSDRNPTWRTAPIPMPVSVRPTTIRR